MVHLRSTQLGISRHTLQRITPVFEEFSVPLKPHMATESVCEEYGKLRDHATTILDLRKQLEKAEHDLKVAQAKTGGAGDDPKKGEVRCNVCVIHRGERLMRRLEETTVLLSKRNTPGRQTLSHIVVNQSVYR